MKKIDENISIVWFIGSIVGGIFLIFLSYYLSTKYGIETSLTAYVAVLGAVPTAYLWIVKEKKKEKELHNKEKEFQNKDKEFQNKEKELLQQKFEELNKIYVDSIKQLYGNISVLAGGYSLEALIYSWFELLDNSKADKTFINIKIQQISSTMFSLSKYEDFKSRDVAKEYFKITGRMLVLITQKIKTNKMESVDWESYNINNLNLSKANLRGVDLHGTNLKGVNLGDADLGGADLRGVNLSDANLGGGFLFRANLVEADLKGANLSSAELTGSYISNNLSVEQVKASNFGYIFDNEVRYEKDQYLMKLAHNL